MANKKKKKSELKIFKLIRRKSFQRLLAIGITLLVLSAVVAYGAAPVKYKLNQGDISQYDIQAPRDIENTLKTLQNAEDNADKLNPVIIEIENANSDMLNDAYEYFDELDKFIMKVIEDKKLETISEKIQRIDTLEAYSILLELEDTALESIFTNEGKQDLVELKRIVIREIIPEIGRAHV